MPYKIYMFQTKLLNIPVSKQTIPSKKLCCLVKLDFFNKKMQNLGNL